MSAESRPTNGIAPIYGHHEADYEQYGERFAVHMNHMTLEQLDGKSEIAWELAYRDVMIERLTAQLRLALEPVVARPLSEWHESDGFVVWWKFPVNEPSYIGSPNDSDWPGYHTHWTPHPAVPCPATTKPAQPEPEWERDNDVTRDLLGLVGYDVMPAFIESWTDEQVRHVDEWAAAQHLKASDNDDVEIPPQPSCIDEWQSLNGRVSGG